MLVRKNVNTVLMMVLLGALTVIAAMAQSGTTTSPPVDISSTVTTAQGQILAYLPTILAAAAAVTVAFTGAKVFMKWLSSRAKSS